MSHASTRINTLKLVPWMLVYSAFLSQYTLEVAMVDRSRVVVQREDFTPKGPLLALYHMIDYLSFVSDSARKEGDECLD